MSAAVWIGWAAAFVLGPLICAGLWRLPRTRGPVVALALGVIASVLGAMVARRLGLPPVVGLGLLWLGWVLAVAMLGLALRRRLTEPRHRRALRVSALFATTLPWFGLTLSRMMV